MGVDDLKARNSGEKDKFDSRSLEDRRSVTGVLLHSVDISNPLLPKFELCEQWACKINEEFINQFKNEKAQGLPVTKMWEDIDNPVGFCKSQIGFVDFIVAPLWNN